MITKFSVQIFPVREYLKNIIRKGFYNKIVEERKEIIKTTTALCNLCHNFSNNSFTDLTHGPLIPNKVGPVLLKKVYWQTYLYVSKYTHIIEKLHADTERNNDYINHLSVSISYAQSFSPQTIIYLSISFFFYGLITLFPPSAGSDSVPCSLCFCERPGCCSRHVFSAVEPGTHLLKEYYVWL